MQKSFLLICGFFLFSNFALAQKTNDCEYLRIAFYNVENYFDPRKDSVKNDSDFTPEGSNHWTFNRFYQKRDNIYKTLIALGEWCPPAVVGLCELENEWVLKELCNNTPLRKFDYHYIHFESPDARGIDVALLYRNDLLSLLESKPIRIDFPGNPSAKTRDILYVKGLVFEKDTIHFYVVHLPSKLGGAESEERRRYIGSILKSSVDSLLVVNKTASIVLMGDFNENPEGKVSQHYLQAALDTLNWKGNPLFNLTAKLGGMQGSYKYQGQWDVIDQIIVSKSFFSGGSLSLKNPVANIFSASFLLEDDDKFLGKKPFRTYVGMKYHGGFSDHLPVYFDLYKQIPLENGMQSE